jgi:hypothetical protein
VLRILRDRFPGQEFDRALFAVVGDLNDQPASVSTLAPLLDGSGLVNAFERNHRGERTLDGVVPLRKQRLPARTISFSHRRLRTLSMRAG